MLDRETVDQGSIARFPPEIRPDFRGKLDIWESFLTPPPEFSGK
jgi:hypothetical protein